MEQPIEQERFSRVLVIEDDEMQRHMLAELLEDEGLEAIGCSNASEALREFEKDRVSVAVLDLRLPDLTGVQLLDRLGAYAEHVSIIINTAHSSYESARDALNFGAFAYVEKAGDPEELLRHVHRAIAHQLRRHNERLETVISENQARLASVFRAAPVGIGLLCGRTLMEVNDTLCEMTGYRPEELIGHDSRMLYVTQADYESVGTVRGEQASERALATRWQHKNGQTRHIRLSWTRLDPQDPAKGVTFTALDITESKHTEEELQNIFNLSLDMVCIIDSHTFAFVKVNPAFTRTLGYEEAELVGQSFLTFIHPDDVAPTSALVRDKLRKGKSVRGSENRYRCKNGSYRWLSWASQPKPEQGLTYAVARDITEQKQVETALRESERRYRAVVEDQTEFICRFTPDKRVTFVNEAMCRFFGKSREALLGRSFGNFMPADEGRKMDERLASLTPDRPIEAHDNLGLLPSGEEFWGRWTNRAIFDDAKNLVEFQAVGRDATEQHRMLEALRHSEERYRLLITSAAQPIFALSRDGVFLLMNKAAAADLDGQPADFLGRSIWELFPEDVAHNHMRDAQHAIDSGQLLAVTRDSVVRGDRRWYDVRVQCIDNDERYALFILTDVTQAKRAEEALRQNEQLLREAEQIAHVGSFSRSFLTEEINWSDETYRLFDYEPGEVKPSIDFLLSHIHPDDRERFLTASDPLAQSGGSYDLEYRILRKGGQVRIVHSRAYVEVDDAGRPLRLFGAIQDVTERLEAQAALRESEVRFRELAQLLPQTVFEIDAESRLTFVNHSAFESFGYDRDELANVDMSQLFVPEDLERLKENFQKKLVGGPFEDHDYTALRKDGTRFPVLLYSAPIIKDGVPIGLRGIALDITERQHVENALQESKAKLESILESSPNAIIVLDMEGTIEDCNLAALEILGLRSKENILGHSAFEFVAPEHVSMARDVLAAIPENNSVRNLELMLLRPPSSTFLSEISASIMTGPAGDPLGIVVIAADITERKRVEERLLAASNMLDLAPSSITVHDFEGRFLYANRKTFEIHGYPKHEFMALNLHDLDVPESEALIADRMRTVCTQGEAVFKVVHSRKDRSTFPLETYVKQVTWDGTNAMLSIATDITERKRVEEALRESERLLRESQKVANIGHYTLDTQTRSWQSSEVLDRIFGIGPDFPRTANGWLQIVHPDDRDEMRTYFTETVLREHQTFDREYRIVRPLDGATRWLWGLGRLELGANEESSQMIGIIQDITDRKEAEEALRAASREWQTTFDSVSDAIWLLDNNFRIQRCNKATARLFGKQPEQLVGRHCWEIVYGTTSPIDQCPLLRVRTTHHRESTVLRINGRWCEIVVDPILTETGELDGVAHIVSDITERKDAEERLLAYQAKLKSLASELSLAEERERRRIAGDLHDHACQSLALSKMKLQAILDRVLPADEQTLSQICNTLNQTIENVRDLTFDLSSPTLYKFGIEAALEELLRDKLKAEHKIRCRFSNDKQPKPLAADVRVLLFQSVRELLINVIKHAHAREVRLDIRRENDSIGVTVADDGVGFDVEAISSASSRSRSVGLFNIGERLDYIGGRLEMDSQPGRGSRFTLIAPLETEVHVAKENHDGSKDSAC